jgi:hypothetical protein
MIPFSSRMCEGRSFLNLIIDLRSSLKLSFIKRILS